MQNYGTRRGKKYFHACEIDVIDLKQGWQKSSIHIWWQFDINQACKISLWNPCDRQCHLLTTHQKVFLWSLLGDALNLDITNAKEQGSRKFKRNYKNQIKLLNMYVVYNWRQKERNESFIKSIEYLQCNQGWWCMLRLTRL